MRFKVEQHSRVVWFIKRRCDEARRRAYYAALDAVRSDPVANSAATFEATENRPGLRRFDFADMVAVFELDLWRARIRVLECRSRSKPKPRNPGN